MLKLDYKLEQIPHLFTVGEISKNNNGEMYKVLATEFQTAILFERVSDGYRLIGNLPNLYTKIFADGTSEIVLEWAWSKGIGWKAKK